jgi:hypothetical protein
MAPSARTMMFGRFVRRDVAVAFAVSVAVAVAVVERFFSTLDIECGISRYSRRERLRVARSAITSSASTTRRGYTRTWAT